MAGFQFSRRITQRNLSPSRRLQEKDYLPIYPWRRTYDMATNNETPPVSLLDTDLYKLTMQQAVLQNFPDAQVTYKFGNRSPDRLFSRECIQWFKNAVSRLSELALTSAEHDWLKDACPYFTPEYLTYLSQFHFNPERLKVHFIPSNDDPDHGRLDMEVEGPWKETILWEVPLMSLLSEAYFRTVDVDWNYDGQEEQSYQKGVTLLEAGISFNEFGTRRRRSHRTHDLVVKGLKRANDEWSGSKGRLLGTSNVYLAYKHGLKPSGTIAHEWFMAIGASLGYEHANAKALDMWQEVYGTNLSIALTDTFTTDAFFKDLTPERARRWAGLRQDSGDPFAFAPHMKTVYESLGVNVKDKFVVFSDSQNVGLAKKLKEQCDELGMNALFGIGTNFTNDFRTQSSGGKEKSKSLNIVIKIASIDGKPCVKLSDEPMKNTGNPESVRKVKQAFGLDF